MNLMSYNRTFKKISNVKIILTAYNKKYHLKE